MLLGNTNNKPDTITYADRFDAAYRANIERSRWMISIYMYEEAWTLLDSMQPESIPQLYNKAICLYDARDNETILRLLDRAWTLLQQLDGGLQSPRSPQIDAIREIQKDALTYLQPVTLEYTQMFPHILKESILRLMVDSWSELGNNAKVLQIATPLASKGYRNIHQAIEKTKGESTW